MNAEEMTGDDFNRYGIQESDMPDIWARFDAFSHGISFDSEEWLEDDLDEQIKRDEERIESIREEQEMEYWGSTTPGILSRDAERTVDLEELRGGSIDASKELDR